MRPVLLTRHARNRMRWHRISDAAVLDAVSAPDWEEPGQSGRTNRWKQVATRLLRVTCRDEPNRVVVITAVLKKRAGGRGDAP